MKKQVKVTENGWIESIGLNVPNHTHTYDGEINLDKSNETKKWHWNGGDPELRETGASPSGEQAYAEMEAYLRDKYTLNEWANLLDSNPTLVRLIQNEAYQDAVDRADYLAGQDSSLVDQEDADKLREVTKV